MPLTRSRKHDDENEDGTSKRRRRTLMDNCGGEDDEDAFFRDSLCIENRKACGDFTILKACRNQRGVYKVLTESGQIKEMTDVDIEEMVNPNNLPRFCYMLPGYEKKNRPSKVVTGRRLSCWVQPHVLQLEGFVETTVQEKKEEEGGAVVEEEEVVEQNSGKKFREWLDRSEQKGDDFRLPWKKRILLNLM